VSMGDEVTLVREAGDGQCSAVASDGESAGADDVGHFALVHFKAPEPKLTKVKRVRMAGGPDGTLERSCLQVIDKHDFDDLAQTMRDCRGSTYATESIVEPPVADSDISDVHNGNSGVGSISQQPSYEDVGYDSPSRSRDNADDVVTNPVKCSVDDNDTFVDYIEGVMKKSWTEARRASLEISVDDTSDVGRRMSDLDSELASSSHASVSGADDLIDSNVGQRAEETTMKPKRSIQLELENALNEMDATMKGADATQPVINDVTALDKPAAAANNVIELDKPAAAANDVTALDKPAATANDVTVLDKPAATANDVTVLDKPAAAANDVTVLDEPAAVANDVTVLDEPATAANDVTALDKPAAVANDVTVVDEPAAAANDVTVLDEPATAANDVTALDKPAAVANDVTVVDKPAATANDMTVLDKPAAAANDMTVLDEPAAAANDVTVVDKPAAAANDVTVLDEPAAVANDVTVLDKPAAVANDVTVVDKPAATANDMTVLDKPAAAANDMTVLDEPAAAANDVTVVDKPAAVANDVTVLDEPAAVANDVTVLDEPAAVANDVTVVDKPAAAANDVTALDKITAAVNDVESAESVYDNNEVDNKADKRPWVDQVNNTTKQDSGNDVEMKNGSPPARSKAGSRRNSMIVALEVSDNGDQCESSFYAEQGHMEQPALTSVASEDLHDALATTQIMNGDAGLSASLDSGFQSVGLRSPDLMVSSDYQTAVADNNGKSNELRDCHDDNNRGNLEGSRTPENEHKSDDLQAETKEPIFDNSLDRNAGSVPSTADSGSREPSKTTQLSSELPVVPSVGFDDVPSKSRRLSSGHKVPESAAGSGDKKPSKNGQSSGDQPSVLSGDEMPSKSRRLSGGQPAVSPAGSGDEVPKVRRPSFGNRLPVSSPGSGDEMPSMARRSSGEVPPISSPVSGDEMLGTSLSNRQSTDRSQVDSGVSSDYTTDNAELTDSEAFSPRSSRQFQPIVPASTKHLLEESLPPALLKTKELWGRNIGGSNDAEAPLPAIDIYAATAEYAAASVGGRSSELVEGVGYSKTPVSFQPAVCTTDNTYKDNGNAENRLQPSIQPAVHGKLDIIEDSTLLLERVDELAELDNSSTAGDSSVSEQSVVAAENIVTDQQPAKLFSESSIVQIDIIGDRVIVQMVQSDETGVSTQQQVVKENDNSVDSAGESHKVTVLGLQPVAGEQAISNNVTLPSEAGLILDSLADKFARLDELQESNMAVEVKPWSSDPSQYRVMKAEIVEKVDLSDSKTRQFMDREDVGSKGMKRTMSETGLSRRPSEFAAPSDKIRSASSSDVFMGSDASEHWMPEDLSAAEQLNRGLGGNDCVDESGVSKGLNHDNVVGASAVEEDLNHDEGTAGGPASVERLSGDDASGSATAEELNNDNVSESAAVKELKRDSIVVESAIGEPATEANLNHENVTAGGPASVDRLNRDYVVVGGPATEDNVGGGLVTEQGVNCDNIGGPATVQGVNRDNVVGGLGTEQGVNRDSVVGGVATVQGVNRDNVGGLGTEQGVNRDNIGGLALEGVDRNNIVDPLVTEQEVNLTKVDGLATEQGVNRTNTDELATGQGVNHDIVDGLTTEQEGNLIKVGEHATEQKVNRHNADELATELGVNHDDIDGLTTEQGVNHDDIDGLATEHEMNHDNIGGLATEQEVNHHNVVGGLATEQGVNHDDIDGLAIEQGANHDVVDGLTTKQGVNHHNVDELATEQGVSRDNVVGGLGTEQGVNRHNVFGGPATEKEVDRINVGELATEQGMNCDNVVGGVATELGVNRDNVVGGLGTEQRMKRDNVVGGLGTEQGVNRDNVVGGLGTEQGVNRDNVVGGLGTEQGVNRDNVVGGLGTEQGVNRDNIVGGLGTEQGVNRDNVVGGVATEQGVNHDNVVGGVATEQGVNRDSVVGGVATEQGVNSIIEELSCDKVVRESATGDEQNRDDVVGGYAVSIDYLEGKLSGKESKPKVAKPNKAAVETHVDQQTVVSMNEDSSGQVETGVNKNGKTNGKGKNDVVDKPDVAADEQKNSSSDSNDLRQAELKRDDDLRMAADEIDNRNKESSGIALESDDLTKARSADDDNKKLAAGRADDKRLELANNVGVDTNKDSANKFGAAAGGDNKKPSAEQVAAKELDLSNKDGISGVRKKREGHENEARLGDISATTSTTPLLNQVELTSPDGYQPRLPHDDDGMLDDPQLLQHALSNLNLDSEEPLDLDLFRAQVNELPDMLTEECLPIREHWEDQRAELQRSFSMSAVHLLTLPCNGALRSSASADCLNLSYERLAGLQLSEDVIPPSPAINQSHSLNWLSGRRDDANLENRMMRPQSMPVHIDDSTCRYLYGIDSTVLPMSEKSVSAEDIRSLMRGNNSREGLFDKHKSISLDSSKFNKDDDEVTPENVFGGPPSATWSQIEIPLQEQWEAVPKGSSSRLGGNAMGSTSTLVLTTPRKATTMVDSATQVEPSLYELQLDQEVKQSPAEQATTLQVPSKEETNVNKDQTKPSTAVGVNQPVSTDIRHLLEQALAMVQQGKAGQLSLGLSSVQGEHGHAVDTSTTMEGSSLSVQDADDVLEELMVPQVIVPPGFYTAQPHRRRHSRHNVDGLAGQLKSPAVGGVSRSATAAKRRPSDDVRSTVVDTTVDSEFEPEVKEELSKKTPAQPEVENDAEIDAEADNNDERDSLDTDEQDEAMLNNMSSAAPAYTRALDRWESEEILSKRLSRLRHFDGQSDPMLASNRRFLSQQLVSDSFGSQRTIETQTYPEVRGIETQTKVDGATTALNVDLSGVMSPGMGTQAKFGSYLRLVDTGVGSSPPRSPSPPAVSVSELEISQLEVHSMKGKPTTASFTAVAEGAPVKPYSDIMHSTASLSDDEPVIIIPDIDLSSDDDDAQPKAAVVKASSTTNADMPVAPRVHAPLPAPRFEAIPPPATLKSGPSLEELQKEHERFVRFMEQCKGDRAQAKARMREQMRSRQRQFQADRASVSMHDLSGGLLSPNDWDSMSSLLLSPSELSTSGSWSFKGADSKAIAGEAAKRGDDMKPIQLVINVERDREIVIQGSLPGKVVKQAELSLQDIEKDSLVGTELVQSPLPRHNVPVDTQNNSYQQMPDDRFRYSSASVQHLPTTGFDAVGRQQALEREYGSESGRKDQLSASDMRYESLKARSMESVSSVGRDSDQSSSARKRYDPEQAADRRRSQGQEATSKASHQPSASRHSPPIVKVNSRSMSAERLSSNELNAAEMKRFIQRYEAIRRLIEEDDDLNLERPQSRTSVASSSLYEVSETTGSSPDRRYDSPPKRVHFNAQDGVDNKVSSRDNEPTSGSNVRPSGSGRSASVGRMDSSRVTSGRTKEMREAAIETDNIAAGDIDELERLRRERERVRAILAKDLLPSRTEEDVESAEAQLNYLIGQTDVLLTSLDEPWETDVLERVSYKSPESQLSATTRTYLDSYRKTLLTSEQQLEERIRVLEQKIATPSTAATFNATRQMSQLSSSSMVSARSGSSSSSASSSTLTKFKKEIMQDAFQRERRSEQARHDVLLATFGRKEDAISSNKSQAINEPLPDHMTALERAQYFADVRKRLFLPYGFEPPVDRTPQMVNTRLLAANRVRDDIDHTLDEVYGTHNDDLIKRHIMDSRWPTTPGHYATAPPTSLADLGGGHRTGLARDLSSGRGGLYAAAAAPGLAHRDYSAGRSPYIAASGDFGRSSSSARPGNYHSSAAHRYITLYACLFNISESPNNTSCTLAIFCFSNYVQTR
jgi:hypothetical protein